MEGGAKTFSAGRMLENPMDPGICLVNSRPRWTSFKLSEGVGRLSREMDPTVVDVGDIMASVGLGISRYETPESRTPAVGEEAALGAVVPANVGRGGTHFLPGCPKPAII